MEHKTVLFDLFSIIWLDDTNVFDFHPVLINSNIYLFWSHDLPKQAQNLKVPDWTSHDRN